MGCFCFQAIIAPFHFLTLYFFLIIWFLFFSSYPNSDHDISEMVIIKTEKIEEGSSKDGGNCVGQVSVGF